MVIISLVLVVMAMAYPDPIPVLKEKDAIEFLARLSTFELNTAQIEFYREARARFPPED